MFSLPRVLFLSLICKYYLLNVYQFLIYIFYFCLLPTLAVVNILHFMYNQHFKQYIDGN